MERPGHLADLTIGDLTGAGVKKLHARRLKSEPAVFHDALALEDDASGFSPACFAGTAEGDEDDWEGGYESQAAPAHRRSASQSSFELDLKVYTILELDLRSGGRRRRRGGVGDSTARVPFCSFAGVVGAVCVCVGFLGTHAVFFFVGVFLWLPLLVGLVFMCLRAIVYVFAHLCLNVFVFLRLFSVGSAAGGGRGHGHERKRARRSSRSLAARGQRRLTQPCLAAY